VRDRRERRPSQRQRAADRWGIVDGGDGVSVWFEVASG